MYSVFNNNSTSLILHSILLYESKRTEIKLQHAIKHLRSFMFLFSYFQPLVIFLRRNTSEEKIGVRNGAPKFICKKFTRSDSQRNKRNEEFHPLSEGDELLVVFNVSRISWRFFLYSR